MAINPFLTKQTKGVPRYMAPPGRAVKPVFRNGPMYRPRVWLRPGGGGTSSAQEPMFKYRDNPRDTFMDFANFREVKQGPWGFGAIRVGASANKFFIGEESSNWREDFTMVVIWRRWQTGGALQNIIVKRVVTSDANFEFRLLVQTSGNNVYFTSENAGVQVGGGVYSGGAPAVGAWTVTSGVRRGTGTAGGIMKMWQNGVLGVNGTATGTPPTTAAKLTLGGLYSDATEEASVDIAFLAILPIGLPDQMVAKLSLDPMYLWRDPIATQAIGVAASGGGARSRGLIIQ